jgi:hypothetical protein
MFFTEKGAMKSRFVTILFCILFSGQIMAQDKFGRFALGRVEELTSVVRDSTQSILTIISEVPALAFDSNVGGILETRLISPSEWRLILKPGRQIITISAKDYLAEKTEVINFQAKRAYRLRVTQVRAIPGTLSIKTTPDSANLRINGVLLSFKTPFRTENAQPDTYFVEISKERFLPMEKTLVVKSNEVTEWEVELKLGVVSVRIDIANKNLKDVGIVVDGSARGLAPRAIDLAPGRHRLLLQKVGYRYTEKIIDIPEGQQEMRLTEKLDKIKTPFYRKWWFLTGSALAIGGGTAFAVLGNEKTPAAKPLPEAPDFP